MLWARVPETTIDEDRNLAGREYDVWTDTSITEVQPVILPVPIAEPEEFLAQRDLGLRIRALVGAHVPRSAGVGGGRVSTRTDSLPFDVAHTDPDRRPVLDVRKDTPLPLSTAVPSERKASA